MHIIFIGDGPITQEFQKDLSVLNFLSPIKVLQMN